MCVVVTGTEAYPIEGKETLLLKYSLLPSGFVHKAFGDGGIYWFKYKTPHSTREEEADPVTDIWGSYSYVDAEGRRRTINYVAGPLTGFVAEGDLPVAPAAPFVVDPSKPTAITYSVPDGDQQSTVAGDGSYSFSYKTPESTRTEVADPNLNVEGSYSFVDPTGLTRTVNYKAGALTGFVVEDNPPVLTS